jgi:hypothetical protein
MHSERRRAQIGLIAAILVLVVSLAVLIKQGTGTDRPGEGEPAAMSPHSMTVPLSLSAPSQPPDLTSSASAQQ